MEADKRTHVLQAVLYVVSFAASSVVGQELHDPGGRWQVYLGICIAVLSLIVAARLQHDESKRKRTHRDGDI
jgi:hypothetical protein